MEMVRILAALAERPRAEHERMAELLELPPPPPPDAHTGLFDFELHPYASVHLGAEGMLGGAARDRVAGFWRALRLEPPSEPDHLAALLGLYATLAEAEGREDDPARRVLRKESRKALLWEHLLTWVPPFLQRVREVGPPFYREWARTLSEVLLEEAEELGGAPTDLPLHLREAPALPDPRDEGGDVFLRALLAPARSGFILARSDLLRMGRSLGIGLRIGERRFALESLLSQEPAGVLGWLQDEAEGRLEEHRGRRDRLGPVAEHWERRARRTGRLLGELAREQGADGGD